MNWKKRFMAGLLSLLLAVSPSVMAFGSTTNGKQEAAAKDAVYISEELDANYKDPEYVKRTLLSEQEESEPASFSLRALSGSSTQSPFTGSVYTHPSQVDSSSVVLGIDVSEWQYGIDWAKVKQAGVEYAFIRCGYTSLGNSFYIGEDKYFKQNMEGAHAQGIKIGIYYFANSKTVDEAAQEARRTVELLAPYKSWITLPVVFDFEAFNSSYRAYGLSATQISQNAKTYYDIIGAEGYAGMYYGSTSIIPKYFNADILNNYDCWVAQYNTKVTYTGKMAYWQYSSSGVVPGIADSKGNPIYVDCDFWYENETTYKMDTAAVPSVGTAATSIPTENTVVVGAPGSSETVGNTLIPESTQTAENTLVTVNTQTAENTSVSVNTQNAGNTPVTVNTQAAANAPVSEGTQTIGNTEVTGQIAETEEQDESYAPAQVEGLYMSDCTNDSISIEWDESEDAEGYQIYRSNSYGGTYSVIDTVSECTYEDTTVADSEGLQYYYKIVPYLEMDSETYYGEESKILSANTLQSYLYKLKTTAQLNLRKQAGTEYAVVASVPAGMVLKYLKYTVSTSGGKWYKVTYKADNTSYKGYLSGNYVKLYSYSMTTKKVNLRKSADSASKVKVKVPDGTKLTVFSTTTDSKGRMWSYVRYKSENKNYKGYVQTKFMEQI